MKSMDGTTHNRTKKFVFNSFRCIVYLACYSVFSISLVTILIKYNDGVTSTSTEIASQDKLKFPVLTFCPSVAFKNPGHFYKEEDFVSQVFTKEDLFGDDTLQDFMNQSQFVYKETRSELLGLCHTIQFLPELGVQDWTLKPFKIKRNQDLKVYVHDIDEEFWLWRALFPVSIEAVELKVNSRPNDLIADLILKKSETHFISKNQHGSGCKHYSGKETYSRCAMSQFPDFLKLHNVTCMTASQNFPSLKDFPLCEYLDDYQSLDVARILRKFIAELNSLGCKITCISTIYSPVVNTFGNHGPSGSEDLFALHAYYVTTSVVISREFYVYDSVTLLTSVGGTLGLLLGYSALSMILFCIDNLEKFCSTRSA